MELEDLVKELKNEVEVKEDTLKTFTDDMKMAQIIDSLEDVERMQNNLEKIIEWQNNNNMVFNTKKFKVIQEK